MRTGLPGRTSYDVCGVAIRGDDARVFKRARAYVLRRYRGEQKCKHYVPITCFHVVLTIVDRGSLTHAILTHNFCFSRIFCRSVAARPRNAQTRSNQPPPPIPIASSSLTSRHIPCFMTGEFSLHFQTERIVSESRNSGRIAQCKGRQASFDVTRDQEIVMSL